MPVCINIQQSLLHLNNKPTVLSYSNIYIKYIYILKHHYQQPPTVSEDLSPCIEVRLKAVAYYFCYIMLRCSLD